MRLSSISFKFKFNFNFLKKKKGKVLLVRNAKDTKKTLPGLVCVFTIFSLCVCRICHCEGDDECPLIMPCRCTGSLSFVHQACLNQWIKSSDTRCCELCKFDFVMETKLKPLRKVGTHSQSSFKAMK